MKKIVWPVLILLVIVLFTACSKPKEQEQPVQFIDVKLNISPEKGAIKEPVTIEASVTYGDEQVTDGDVEFEIWRSHDEKHEKVKVEHAENGLYRLQRSFDQEGTYYVISHVTAKDMHNMPKKEFVIGSPSEPENESSSHMNMEDEHDDEEEHQH